MRSKRMGPWEWLGVMFKLLVFAALISYAFEPTVNGADVLAMLLFYSILRRKS